MIDWIPVLILGVVIILILLLGFGIKHYYNKIDNSYRNNPSKAKQYSRDLTIGITSAVIVVVLDKIITLIINGIPSLKIDASSILSLFESMASILIFSIFISFFLLFCVLYLIYLGFSKVKKK
jgi:hypothetical protein